MSNAEQNLQQNGPQTGETMPLVAPLGAQQAAQPNMQQTSQKLDPQDAQNAEQNVETTKRSRRDWTTENDIFICALKLLSNRDWPDITTAFNRHFATNEKSKNVSSRFNKTLNPWDGKHANKEYRRALEAWKNELPERAYRWLIDKAHEIVEREDELDGRDPGTVLLEEGEE